MGGRVLKIAGAAALLFFVTIIAWRPLCAWFADDAGNLALFKGNAAAATSWFAYGLRREPGWHLLHEDMGRALLDSNPTAALREFRLAACGAACSAEEGDALLRLGRQEEAIERYIAAKAVVRVAQRAQQLAAAGKDAQALALEHALIARLHDNFLERAELASAYATLGTLQLQAAGKDAAHAAALRHEAIQALGRASALAPYNERFLLLYGFAQMQWGDRAEARGVFTRVLQLHPHQHDAQAALTQLSGASPRHP